MCKVIILVQDHSKYEIIFVSKAPMVACQMRNVSELIKNCVIWPTLEYGTILSHADAFRWFYFVIYH